MNGASLGNPPGFDAEPFASLERMEIRVRLLSLLSDRIEVAQVVLAGPKIRLQRHANGADNWSDLGAETGSEQAASGKSTAPSDEATKGDSASFSVEGLRVENAQLNISDKMAGVELLLQAFNLSLDEISLPLDTMLALETEFDLVSSKLAGSMRLESQVQANLADSVFGLAGGELELTLSGDALPVSSNLPISIRWERISAALEPERAMVKALSIAAAGLAPTMELEATDWSGKLQYQGKVELPSLTPQRVLAALEMEAPVTADDKVLNDLAASFDFSGDAQRVSLEALSVKLDDSTLSGSLSVEDFQRQALRFDLSMDAIDADRYLPPPSETAGTESESTDDVAIPVDILRGLDVLGTLRLGKLTFAGIRSSDIEVGIDARNDQLRLHPARASLYDGNYSGDIRVDVRKPKARYSVDERLQGVKFGAMLKDMFGVSRLSGVTALSVQSTAAGNSVNAIKQSLDGKVSMQVTDGAIEGMNLRESIRKAHAKVENRPYQREDMADRTRFAELLAQGRLEKGVFITELLDMRMPFLRVDGDGRVNLVAATVDYEVRAKVVADDSLEGSLGDLSGLVIPIRITGDIASPDIRPAVGEALKAKARAELDAKREQARQEARDDLDKKKEEAEDKLKDKLKGLFD